ncbi:MAG: hypothetical protein AAB386_03785 [Patescibacteria group bacterium]
MELRTRIYSIILAIIVVALVVVGVLLLRKRQTEIAPRVVGGSSSQSAATSDTKPLDSYQVERPWQAGDPVPTTEELNEGLIE